VRSATLDHRAWRPASCLASPGTDTESRGKHDRPDDSTDSTETVLEPNKILIVDDSKLMHKMFEVMLRQYAMVNANDGREALQILGENDDVDLVLLDINMPNMNGIEFLEEIRSTGQLDGLTVIIISTEGSEEDTARGLEAGATAYIKKPFRTDELLDVISKA
jgi:two-component system chemotaxis response regulator CheY